MKISKKQMIPENWKVIESIEEEVRKQVGDPNAGFNADLFFWGNGRQLAIPVYYRKKNKAGFQKKFDHVMVGARFCPFSGKPLYEEDSETT